MLDAKGSVEYLLAQDNAPDALRIGVVGASNGTTTLVDFTVFATLARSVELPSAVVLLSGGDYTTNQNALDGELTMIPTLFVYPIAEATWNEGVAATSPELWRFVEFDPGAHGTALFAAAPDSVTLEADFLSAELAR